MAAALTVAFAAQAIATSIEGRWKNPIGSAVIEIAPCGGYMCGKVVWASERGQREVAKNRPRIVGTTVLTGLRPLGNRWAGKLYIPDDNITVSARLQPIDAGHLKLTGCALAGLICRTQMWTRVDGPLP